MMSRGSGSGAVPLSVAVVGGGIGGLTAAVALLQAGFDVRVYEQAPALPAVGAGIQLAPNCTRVLGRLGLLPAVEPVAVRPTAFEFRRWDDGRVLSRTTLGDAIAASYSAPYYNAHRGDLTAVLTRAVPPDRVEDGRRCVGVVHRAEGAEVRFADGSSVVADVVVGADGIHSAVRQALFGAEEARFTGHVAYRGLVPAERVAHLGLDHRCTVRLGPGGHVVNYFVGAGRLLNVVCVVEQDSWRRESWTDRAEVAEVRAAFRGWHPVVQGVIEALEAPLKWALFDREPLPCWGAGAVTLLGDACHPMLPYGAQGYAQAVEDAAVLAACLADPGARDVPSALERYAALRRPRASRVQAISRGNGTRFHLPDGPEQEARDAAMASSFGISPEIDWLYGHDALDTLATMTPA
jgi:2-polyprenyl-6-methoxyphenol hydroxylase-like FAD-dependent oxidoreductase